MIELITASAGSGKTYTLAKKYIGILLEAYLKDESCDAHEFEHILAVTFTNKATAEMKDRILQELFILAEDPTLSGYYQDFCSTYGAAAVSDHKTWRRILFTLLHNYSRFSVSTIDTFFQGVLRHFAREIGSYNSYRIELDRDALIAESADSLLSKISDSADPVYKVVSALTSERIGAGKKLDPKRELTEIAKNLMGGEFIRSLESLKVTEQSVYDSFIEEVKTGKSVFSDKVESLEISLRDGLKTAMKDALDAAKSFRDNIVAYNGGVNLVKKTILSGIEKFIVSKATSGFSEAMTLALQGDESKLFNKSAPDKEDFIANNQQYFDILLGRSIYIGRIAEIRKCIPHLKFAVAVFKEFAEVTDSANVKCLEDTTKLLSEIIAGSEAPFIYEKIGTRYNHYLLDEFQDTSHVQWNNFEPLLVDANANGGHNLVVGDVKQSIYRWRNSDYTILDSTVPNAPAFKGQIAKTPLSSNFRSARHIVEFNNDLFAALANAVDNKLAQFYLPSRVLKDIYLLKDKEGNYIEPHTVGQVVRKDFDGFVRYEEVKGENATDVESKIFPQVVALVKDLVGRGVKKNDILILVRGKAEGSHIAEDLLREGIGVYSDDSLFVSSNAIARKLLAVLRYLDNRNDEISKAITNDLGDDFLDGRRMIFHSTLVDLCETIIAKLKAVYSKSEEAIKEFEGSIPYLSSFVDIVSAYETNYGNSLHNFIAYFDNKDAKIASSASQETVRIMTIHKSKGLDGEFVIVPFINKITLWNPQHNQKWTEVDNVPLPEECGDFTYYASLVAGEQSAFHGSYVEEYKQRSIDAMNMLYVAFTRAQHALFVLDGSGAKETLSSFATAYLAGKEDGGLKRLDEEGMCYELGSLEETVTDYLTPREESNLAKKRLLDDLRHQDVITSDYAVYESRGAVRNSLKATDFFEGLSEDGSRIEGKDSRVKGILQHDILSAVHTVDDVAAAVEAKWQDGVLDITRQEAEAYLAGRINSVSGYGWFAPEASVSAEEAMLVKVTSLARGEMPVATRKLSDGTAEYIVNRRPDRIVEHPDGSVSIVDYKFTGESGANLSHYRKQVEAYCAYYRALPGNASKIVRGYIWYVNAGEVFAV